MTLRALSSPVHARLAGFSVSSLSEASLAALNIENIQNHSLKCENGLVLSPPLTPPRLIHFKGMKLESQWGPAATLDFSSTAKRLGTSFLSVSSPTSLHLCVSLEGFRTPEIHGKIGCHHAGPSLNSTLPPGAGPLETPSTTNMRQSGFKLLNLIFKD